MRSAWIAAALAAGAIVPAQAGSIYIASGTAAGRNVGAETTFAVSGSNLDITLSATSGSGGAFGPGSGLSGLFFAITGDPTLTPASATLAAGASIVHACSIGPCTGAVNLDGEWGYQFSRGGFGSSAPAGNYGIASSGYLTTGLPGDIGNFNGGHAGTNLNGTASLGGPDFEILPAGVTFNGGLARVPVVESEVNFVLSNLPAGFTLSDISHVSFQYGTSYSETNLAGTCGSNCGTLSGSPSLPEPPALPVLAAGLLGLGLLLRRRRA